MALQSKLKETLPAGKGRERGIASAGERVVLQGICDVLARIGIIGQCIKLYIQGFYSGK